MFLRPRRCSLNSQPGCKSRGGVNLFGLKQVEFSSFRLDNSLIFVPICVQPDFAAVESRHGVFTDRNLRLACFCGGGGGNWKMQRGL
jgi:hypothetical protein